MTRGDLEGLHRMVNVKGYGYGGPGANEFCDRMVLSPATVQCDWDLNSWYETDGASSVFFTITNTRSTRLGFAIGVHAVSSFSMGDPEPGQPINGYVLVPQLGQSYPKASPDGKMRVASPMSYLKLVLAVLSQIAKAAARHLAQSSPAYDAFGSVVAFESPVPIELRYRPDPAQAYPTDLSSLAIYRFDGASWEKTSILDQRARQEPDGTLVVGGKITITGTFAAFFKLPDALAPRTVLEFGEPFFSTAPVYITTATVMRLVSQDDLTQVGDGAGLGVAFQEAVLRSAAGPGERMLRFDNPAPSSAPFLSTFRASQEGEGRYSLSFFGQDTLGNREQERTAAVAVDGTAPISSAALRGPMFEAAPTDTNAVGGPVFAASHTLVSLVSQDPVSNEVASGLSRVMFGTDGSPETRFLADFPIAAEGSRTVTFQGIDNVENAEPPREFTVWVDSTAPITDISFLGASSSEPGLPSEAQVFMASSTRVALTAQDPASRNTASGVLETLYRVDQGPWQVYEEPFLLPGEGLHAVSWYSRDRVFNQEAEHALLIGVDHTSAQTTMAPGEPRFQAFGLEFLSPKTALSLNSVDLVSSGVASGLGSIRYRIDSGPERVYVSSFTLDPGSHLVEYWSKDKVENKETPKTATLVVAQLDLAALAGVEEVEVSGNARVSGLVQSNGEVKVSGDALIAGDVQASSVAVKGGAQVIGAVTQGIRPLVAEPINLAMIAELAGRTSSNALIPEEFFEDCVEPGGKGHDDNDGCAGREGTLAIEDGRTLVLGTGTYVLNGLEVEGRGSLEARGLVSLLVRGKIKVEGEGQVNAGGRALDLVVFGDEAARGGEESEREEDEAGRPGKAGFGGKSRFQGLVYVPRSKVKVSGKARVTGHLFARQAGVSGNGSVIQPGHVLPEAVSSSGGKTKVAEVPASVSADPTFAFRDFYAFPNPAKSENPTIRVRVGLADSVEVDIYDVSGRRVHHAAMGPPRVLDDGNGQGPQWTYDHVWNTSSVGSGVYVCFITAAKAGDKPIRKTAKVGVLR